ncbi:DUF427 domain-containing protein [soil metagenome]
MKATFNGTVIARSEETKVVEGNHYFPADSVDSSYLTATSSRSLCPWKGLASYYTVEVDGVENANAAWAYKHPYPWIRKIRNHVAFWNGVEVTE